MNTLGVGWWKARKAFFTFDIICRNVRLIKKTDSKISIIFRDDRQNEMARKRRNKQRTRSDHGGSGFVQSGLAVAENDVARRAPAPKAPQREWFSFYKSTQGYWTRMCTAVGWGIVVLWGAKFLFEKLSVYGNSATGQYVQMGVAIMWMLGLGFLVYYLVGRQRSCCDFLIAVEGEMKKVSWSTRTEIIGATKVVVLFTVLMSILLFVIDTMFMVFFSSIGVLKIGSGSGIIKQLFGL